MSHPPHGRGSPGELPAGRALVTGASGVVGRALVAHLAAEGWMVRGLARSHDAAERVRRSGGQPVAGHLRDPEALRRAAEGCEVLFHVAGLNAYCQRDPRALFEINVRGALVALRAAEAVGLRRFVHTSSAVTIGEPAGRVGHESIEHRGHFLTDYERSKHEAELALLSEPTPVEVVVVNPSSVQGPGRLEGTGRFFLDLARGRQRLLVDGRLDLVEIEDCARGHRLAALRGRPGERYLLSGFDIGMRELHALMERLLERRLPAAWLPPRLLWPAGQLAAAAARLLGREAPLCPETVRNLRHQAVYDGSRAARELGLHYRDAEATFGRLIDWYRHQGLLPSSKVGSRAGGRRSSP